MILDVNQFLTLRESLPVIDVRSEDEFNHGRIPLAINIPVLNNAERVVVGTIYKQQGQKEAIKAGFRLVGPRLAEMIESAENVGNELIVHCWRGGMRSANFCQFVGMAGLKTHQLKGGYKAYRNVALESFKLQLPLIVISGFTGSGKSELLHVLKQKGEQVLDLEDLANHKGSVFGGLGRAFQPTTEQFQNNLFEVLRKFDLSRTIWVEDESIAIGKIFLPADFWNTLRSGPIIEMEVPKSERISRLVKEYGTASVESFHEAMKGIIKKLGGQHYNTAREKLFGGDLSGAIDIILTYYDKAYANGMERKKDRIKLRVPWDGKEIDVLADYIRSQERNFSSLSVF